MRDPHGEPSDLIRSVSRAFRVLEAVGYSPRGLTVKQLARRCDLTVATTYHLIRTLAYEGYVMRREDGSYVLGLEISDRFRELAAAFRGPPTLIDVLRGAAAETGYSHFMGRFVAGRVAITAVAEGARSPYVEDLMPGFDDGAHATALGKSLLATLGAEQRMRYVKEWGMRSFTPRTLVTPDALDADLAAADRKGLHVDKGEYRVDVACVAMVVLNDIAEDSRVAVGCAIPATEARSAVPALRTSLAATSRALAEVLATATEPPEPPDGEPAR